VTTILDLYQAAGSHSDSRNLRFRCFTLTQPSPVKGEDLHKGKQVIFLGIVNHEVGKRGQVLATSLGVAAGGDNQGLGVSAPGQPEPVARLAVSDMGDCAGIGNINIGLIVRGHKLKARTAELAG